MLEKASIRLILVWEIATMFPTVIVATQITHMIEVQSGRKAGKAEKKTLIKAENPAAFTPVAMNAVMEVGAPS